MLNLGTKDSLVAKHRTQEHLTTDVRTGMNYEETGVVGVCLFFMPVCLTA